MTLCPIALAVGCRKCAIVSMCPLKSVVGDWEPPSEPEAKPADGSDAGKADGDR